LLRVPILSSTGRDRVSSTAGQEGPLCGQAGKGRWTGQDTPTKNGETDRSASAVQEWSKGTGQNESSRERRDRQVRLDRMVRWKGKGRVDKKEAVTALLFFEVLRYDKPSTEQHAILERKISRKHNVCIAKR
jgi:hypothetical protein